MIRASAARRNARAAWVTLLVLAAAAAVAGCKPKVPPPLPVTAVELFAAPPEASLPWQRLPGARHLVDAEGRAVYVQGDAAWSLMVGATLEEAGTYFRTRRAQGFNAALINLIEHHFVGPDHPYGAPFTRDGDAPFLQPGRFDQPNEAYFAHVDRVLALAAREGITVFLVPAYLGLATNPVEGFQVELAGASLEACGAYGRFLGQRYAGLNNIVWVAGGDCAPGELRSRVLAIVEGIRAFQPNALWTAHSGPDSSAADHFGSEPWLALNTTYSYDRLAEELARNSRTYPLLPNLFFESDYEGNPRGCSSDCTRRNAWMAALSGTCGQFFGNKPVWLCGERWLEHLDSPGARSQGHLTRFLATIPWPRLVPAEQGLLEATAGATGPAAMTIAVDREARFAVAYLPFATPVATTLEALAGPEVRITWFNPRDGGSTAAGTWPRGSRRTFTPPGTGDWVWLAQAGTDS